LSRRIPLDFPVRLAALLPPPRMHLTRYHGVFAPHAAPRSAITPAGRRRGKRTHIPFLRRTDRLTAQYSLGAEGQSSVQNNPHPYRARRPSALEQKGGLLSAPGSEIAVSTNVRSWPVGNFRGTRSGVSDSAEADVP